MTKKPKLKMSIRQVTAWLLAKALGYGEVETEREFIAYLKNEGYQYVKMEEILLDMTRSQKKCVHALYHLKLSA